MGRRSAVELRSQVADFDEVGTLMDVLIPEVDAVRSPV